MSPFYLWETEALRLSQSPHDIWEGPELSPVCFSIQVSVYTTSSSPLLLFKAAVKPSWVLCTYILYINSLYMFRCCSCCQLCPTLCDPTDCSTPGFLVLHYLLELAQTHAHQVGDAIQPSHPLSSPSPPAPNPSQHQGLFKCVNSSHEVAKVLEFQPQHQSFQ